MEIKQSTPVLQYSRSYVEEKSPEEAAEALKQASGVSEAVTRVILGICMAAWAVIGLFLWIPRVLRAVVAFSLELVQSTVSETTADAAGRNLRSAANFYRRGFVGAVEAIRPSTDGDEQGQSEVSKEAESAQRALLVRETAWAIVIWYAILWSTGIIRGTSADLATVPWGRIWSAWVEAIWSVPTLLGLG